MVAMTEMPSREEKVGSAGITGASLWPKLGETSKDASENAADNDEWEFVSEEGSESSNDHIESFSIKPKMLHHCSSTPDLNHYEPFPEEGKDDEEASFDRCSMGVDAQSVMSESSHVLVSHTPASPEKPLTRRVPSFKDAILLNAQEAQREEVEAAKRREQAKVMLRKEAQAKRRSNKPRLLVVKPAPNTIKRNTKSTGDLNSLLHSSATIYEDDECHDMGGGGGGGGGFAAVQEDEIMGDTDAQDFYAQKSKGGKGRVNSKKIRPDEAKRLDIILFKKEEQRRKQQEKEAGGKVTPKKKDSPKKQKGQ